MVVRVDLSERPTPAVGTAVEAVGILETDLCDLTLSHAFWHPSTVASLPPEAPVERTLEDLFSYGKHRHASINVREHGRTLTVRGTVKLLARGPNGNDTLLLVDRSHSLLVRSDIPLRKKGLSEGAVVSATGVCVKDSDVWRPNVPMPKIRRIFLVLRSPDDLAVLQPAPWWTPHRIALALAILPAVLVAVFVWNATLRVLINRRTREVIKAQTSRIGSELRVEERTRLAADLHDSLSQTLTVIGYQVSAARRHRGTRRAALGRLYAGIGSRARNLRTSLDRL